MPTQLLDLPNEVLNHVLLYLKNDICLEQRFSAHPKTRWLELDEKPLKHVSVLCKRLRQLSLPIVFLRARLNPVQLTYFLEFVKEHNLRQAITSVVAHIEGPISHVHPAWWCRLLNEIPAQTLIIAGAPSAFSEIAKLHVTVSDGWAFNIPYQLLELKQTVEAAQHHISYSNLPSIFASRPWYSIRVNEGSMLAAYTRYEYFLKKTPSLMADLQLQLNDYMTSAGAIPPEMMPHSIMLIQELFQNLQEFAYVAVFPFYNHTDEILKCIKRMTMLKRLTMKLCPEQDSQVLEEEIEAAKHHIDLNDPWNEFHTSYGLIASNVLQLGYAGQLQRFTTGDFHMEGVRASVETQINDKLHNHWTYDGLGTWTKNPPVELA